MLLLAVKLASNNAAYSDSFAAAAVASRYEEEEAFESLEELEAQTIGNLLPDDDDLLSGVTDGFDNIMRPNNGEDMEDLDLFSNVGGLELGEDGFAQRNSELSDLNSIRQLAISVGSNGGEHPFGEHPSRTLFVRNINSNVEDSELRSLFEVSSDHLLGSKFKSQKIFLTFLLVSCCHFPIVAIWRYPDPVYSLQA